MRATTKAGEPCPVAATASGLCYLHDDPSRAKEMGRKGGLRNRRVIPDETAEMPPLNTADDVRAMLAKLAQDVRRKVEPKVAASVSQIASTAIKEISDEEWNAVYAPMIQEAYEQSMRPRIVKIRRVCSVQEARVTSWPSWNEWVLCEPAGGYRPSVRRI